MTFFTKHLKSHALGYFQICKHLCAMECENSYPNVIILFYMIENFIWMNITTMPMIQHISNILGCSLDYFLTKCLIKIMAWPMEGVWQIGRSIFFELIWHSLMGECSMIGLITLCVCPSILKLLWYCSTLLALTHVCWIIH